MASLIASGAARNRSWQKQLRLCPEVDDSSYRIGLTFRSPSDQICRSFDGESLAGIACKAKWIMAARKKMIPGKATG